MKEISSISDGHGAGAPAGDDPDRTGVPRSPESGDPPASNRGLTLGRWFFLWMLLVALLALGTTVVVVLAAQAEDLTERLEQRGRSAIRAASASDWDDQSGSLLITALPELVAAEVRDQKGGLVWQYGPFDEILEDPAARVIVVSESRLLTGSGRRTTLDVTLALSTTSIGRQGLRTGARLVLSLGLVLALGMVGGMIMINRVVEPLREVAESVAAFDPGAPFEMPEGRGGAREVRMLDAAFRSMAARLVTGRQALARSEQRFRGLFESSPIALLEIDAAGRIIGANPASRSLIGGSVDPPSEPLRLEAFLEAGAELARQALETDRVFSVEAVWETASGQELEVDLHFQRVGGDGPPVSLLAVRDLSDRLRQLGERWQRTLDEMDEGVALLTDGGLPIQTNRPFDRFGAAVLSRAAEHPGTIRREWRQQVGDRSLRCVAAPVSDGGERVLVVRDETEWIQAEEQVREGRTMEAVATLAGGVAHDFNNLLAGILLHLRVLEKGADSGDEALRTIRELAEEGADVVRGLVDFANPDRGPKEAVDLVPLVDEQIRLLRRLLPDGIELLGEIEPKTAVMVARAGDLRRILVNLVLNARDALGDRPGTIEMRLTATGREATLTVTDTGPGVPSTIRDRIFEPFFSLRREGRGSGLGLAVTYALVAEHDGSIEHEDPPAGGARFIIRFPLRDPDRGASLDGAELIEG